MYLFFLLLFHFLIPDFQLFEPLRMSQQVLLKPNNPTRVRM